MMKIPFAVSSRRVLRYIVNKITFAKSANVDSAERIVFSDKIIPIKSPNEYVG